MNAQDILKTYAIFYVSENDEFDTAKKLDMLNFIEQADEMMLMDLFENGEIESPSSLNEVDEMEIAKMYGINLEGFDISSIFYDDIMMTNIQELSNTDTLKRMLGMKISLKGQLGKVADDAKYAIKQKISALDDKIVDAREAIAKGAGKAVKAGGKALEKGKEMVGDAGDAVAKGAKAAGKAVKGVTDNAGQAIEKGAKAAGKAVEKGAEAAGDAVNTAAKYATVKGGQAAEKIGKAVGGKAEDALKYATVKGGQAAEKIGKGAQQAGDAVAGAASKAAEFAQGHGGMIGAAAAAAAALTAGVMAYRRFFSKAAQACKTAPDRAACLSQYKMKAKQAQIATVNAGKAKCAKTKDPAKCKAKIDAKINTLKAKMRG